MAQPFQFDEWENDAEDRPIACLVCEAMCPDAVDGTLSEAERRAFEKHVVGCTHCAQELEDAQRGAAWLSLLKSKAPEPPATLIARILAETTGAVTQPASLEASILASDVVVANGNLAAPLESLAAPHVSMNSELAVPSLAASDASRRTGSLPSGVRSGTLRNFPHPVEENERTQTDGASRGGVLPFYRKAQLWVSEKGVSALHPRLAMTAAMAFFSIALTLNLTGVRLSDMRAENFRPGALQRTAVNAEATAVRSFQSLRVVYQVESRVSELRQDPLWTQGTNTEKKPNSSTSERAEDPHNASRGQN